MRAQAQVVVIGGGAVGASCLYHLAKAGITDCLLIEKDELTSGSTWHAAGNIPTYAHSWLGMRAGNYAWQLYKDLDSAVDAPITYRHTGAFWPAHTKERMAQFEHLVGLSQSAGFGLEMLEPGQMEARHPYYSCNGDILGGIFDPYEGDIDPSQLTQALAKGARDLGGEVARFTKVTGITRTASGDWLVQTDRGDVTCESIVNATGFYGDQVTQLAGGRAPIAVLEHQYLVTDPVPDLEADQALFPLVRDPDIRFYLRRERASFLFGSYGHAGRLAFADGVPEAFAHSLFPDSVDDILEVFEGAMAHIPLLEIAGAQRFINGPIAYSPDAQPLCGPATGLPNFYQACGIQVGITQSAAVGKAITEWITEGETEWDLTAWDPRRFGDWADEAFARARIVDLYGLQYAIPYPHRLLASGRPLQCTPLYDRLQKKGAQFGQIGGWERAMWFDRDGQTYDEDKLSFEDDEPWQEAVRQECEAVRDAVGIMDHGGFTKYELKGPGAKAFLELVFCGTAPGPGRVKLSYMLTPKGKVWSEATIAYLADDHYLLCGPTLALDRDYDWLATHMPDDGSVTLSKGSPRDAALMVMGPRSRELLGQLTDGDLSADAMPWMSVRDITLAGRPVTALRVSYVGELGWELHMASKDLSAIYDACWDAGRDLGLADFGSYALNAMRIEKGYHGWGADFGCEYSPFEAGLAGFVNFKKDDFVGRDAALAARDDGLSWHFTGFVLEGAEADPLAGDPITQDGQWIGYVTSASQGFRLDQRFALGYVRGEALEEGTKIKLTLFGKMATATVAMPPFYDPQNTRLKS
ncbi:MAG: FAD-dependent oxidoreductase [Pseudomonadota bacterium]